MLLPELQGGSPPCNSLQRNTLRPGFSSGSASERAQGSWVRRHRLSLLYHPGWRAAPLPAGEPDRGTRLGLERSQSGYLSEVFPLIPAPTPSVVPCSISCGSYAVITRQRISWDITNSAPISARLAPASTRRKNIRNCIRLRDI